MYASTIDMLVEHIHLSRGGHCRLKRLCSNAHATAIKVKVKVKVHRISPTRGTV